MDESQGDQAEEAFDRGAEVWPPRPGPLAPWNYTAADAAELHLGPDPAPPAEPSFTPSKLSEREGMKVAVGAGGARNAVVFDPKNPSGRMRRDEIFDANDDDFRRRRRRQCRRSALCGALIFVGCIAAFFVPTPGNFAIATIVGSAAGVGAVTLGDRSESWLIATLLGGLALSPLIDGPAAFVVIGVVAASGWLTGFVRELS